MQIEAREENVQRAAQVTLQAVDVWLAAVSAADVPRPTGPCDDVHGVRCPRVLLDCTETAAMWS